MRLGSGRGSTGVGRPAVRPAAGYRPAPTVGQGPQGLVVTFHGEDDRQQRYEVSRLPLPGWHEPLAVAVAERIGPGGGRRTLASADGLWTTVGRFLRALSQLPHPPGSPAALDVRHLQAWQRSRVAAVGEIYAWHEARVVGTLLRRPALRSLVSTEVIDYISRRRDRAHPTPKPGYTDGELRRLLGAARTDVARIRDRLDAGGRLAAVGRDAPGSLPPAQRRRAEQLATIVATGIVPSCPGPFDQALPARFDLASQLFLTPLDLAPLLVLAVGVTGCNAETIKELPTEHRILEGRAVELRVTKRRRGQQRWQETVTWEIGPPGRELHTPGGLYLLLHRLTSRGRGFCGDPASLWSIWRNGHKAGVHAEAGEHHNPFGRSLKGTNINAGAWAARHELRMDQLTVDAEAGAAAPVAVAAPLPVDFNRLRTSIEVRRIRQQGGHLPSAARTNSIPVLFANYLRGDPTVTDWAQATVSQALADAERSALTAHQRALNATGGQLRVVAGTADAGRLQHAGLDASTAERAASGALDTAWSACVDHDAYPGTGQPCRQSFLDCFHCGNCLVTREHLPRLLGLLDALTARRQQLPETDWWTRYGPAWAAIRHDILTRFSPAEIAEAAGQQPDDCLLDLVEAPWEQL